MSKLPSAVSSPGQQRFHVDVEGEKIANRVVVFRAIEAMHGADSSGIRIRCPRAVDPCFPMQSATARYVAASGRGFPGGGMEAGTQFHDDFFEHLGIGARLGEIHRFEIESGGLSFLAMAGDAVLVDDRPWCWFIR